jgi:cytoskeletal protein RodZ
MSFGANFREARESAGFSLEEIAQRTRIRLAVIQDLESEKFDSSGGLAYARGHIRTIAKIVHADLDHLMAAFDEITEVDTTPMIELLDANNATSVRSRQSTKLQPRQIMIAASVIAGIAIIIPSSIAISHNLSQSNLSQSNLSRSIVSQKSTATSKVTLKSSQQTVAPTLPPVQQPATTAAIPAHSVSIVASHGTSWLSVTDASGAQLFSGKLSNGASQSFDPTNGLSMRIGNAGAVSVSVDGKDQGSIGATGEVKSLTFAPAQTNG